MKKLIIFAFALLLFNPLLVVTAQAQSTPASTAQNALPKYSDTGVDQSIKDYLCTPSQPADGQDLTRCINKLYRFGIAAGALSLVLFVVIAGYFYITGGEQGKGKAKGILMNAATGMGILLFSYVLLRFINPSLVTFKPIQPPIFTANELPSCEELGFGDGCVMEGDETVNSTATSDGGTGKAGIAVSCKGGVISTPAAIPHTSGASRICKDLADRLLVLKSKTSIPWIVTSTIRSGNAQSGCHGANADKAGNCADIQVLNTRQYAYAKNNGGSKDPRWGQFCKDVISIGGVNFANEASTTPECEAIRKYHVYKFTSGPHVHVNYIGQ